MMNNKPLSQYKLDAIGNGYVWECACGELYRTREHACTCRKCREYLVDFYNREDPINISDQVR